MRVAYICADRGIPAYSSKGAAYHIQEFVRAMSELGHDVELFALRVGGPAPADLQGIPVHEIPFTGRRSAIEDERELLRVNFLIGQMLAAHGPFDIVYERHALWSYAAMEYAKEAGAIGVLEVNAPLIQEHKTFRQLHDETSVTFAANRAFNAAAKIAVVSANIVDYARQHGAEVDRIHVVPNGVRVGRFTSGHLRTGQDTRPFTIGFVGSLRPWHAVDDLLEAFARMQSSGRDESLALRIVGDGPQRNVLDNQLTTYPASMQQSVCFTGAVDYDDIPEELAQLDVAVAPYTGDHGGYCSPLKLFEYMAAGLPVVAARTGPVKEIIRCNENGLLYAPGDIDGLAAAVWELHDSAPQRLQIGRTARHDVEQHHTWRQRVIRVLNIAISRPEIKSHEYRTTALAASQLCRAHQV